MRRSITDIMERIKEILEKEGELSVYQISRKVSSEWETVIKALESMKKLGLVKERLETETDRKSRLFSLK